jgi:DNA recombination protein RmuC
MALVLGLIVGALLGGTAAWLVARARVAALAAAGREELARVQSALEYERLASAEKVALLEQAREELTASFEGLSSEALRANNSSFLELAKSTLERYQVQARDDLDQRRRAVEQLISPITQSLERVDGKIQQLEQARREAYGAVVQQVRSLAEGQERLRAETGNLVTALRAPATRGRWGEIQLRRVVEMAGMLPHCDFVEQVTVQAEDRRLRPDVVVKLPGGKNVVVDAKVPLQSYLDAIEADDDDVRRARLADHARQLRQHVAKLSAKSYWEQFRPTPEFVVLFLGSEAFYSAALDQDPALIEEAVSQRVLIATPTTLIGLLKAIAYGWQQERVAESARAVSELGRELYDRLAVLGEHFITLGKRLDGTVSAYNQAVGSLERRVLPAARRFPDLGAGGQKDIPQLSGVDKVTQSPQAPELLDEGPADGVVELPAAAEPAASDLNAA